MASVQSKSLEAQNAKLLARLAELEAEREQVLARYAELIKERDTATSSLDKLRGAYDRRLAVVPRPEA